MQYELSSTLEEVHIFAGSITVKNADSIFVNILQATESLQNHC